MSNAIEQAVRGCAGHTSTRPIIIGLGNPFRGDDAVGLHVIEQLEPARERLDTATGSGDALWLISTWQDRPLTVVVDAAITNPGCPSGTVHRLDLTRQALPKTMARCTSHGLGLAEALSLGAALDRLPARLVVYAIEAGSFDPGTALTPAVRQAVSEVVDRVLEDIEPPGSN
ncbi:MAG: hydrogenase maturation protease [Gammaproteobacteria bacterium]|nr:hydrogenase maturation protease [Gammaproteobacteria bacterium]